MLEKFILSIVFCITALACYCLLKALTHMSVVFKGIAKDADNVTHYNLEEILGNETSQYILAGLLGCFSALLLSPLGFWTSFLSFSIVSCLVMLYLKRRALQRKKKIETQVVIVLNLLSNAMRSGRTLPQAIEAVSAIAPEPIAYEMTLVSRKIRLGFLLVHALEAFEKRINLKNTKLAVKAMAISIKTGSNLPKAMTSIATVITSGLRIESKIQVLTAQSRFQSLLIGFMPIFLFIAFYYISPDYITVLLNTKTGNLILMMIVMLQAIGFYITKKIMAITI